MSTAYVPHGSTGNGRVPLELPPRARLDVVDAPATLLEVVAHRLVEANGRLIDLHCRVEAAGERLLGPRGDIAHGDKNAPAPSPSYHLGRIERALDDIEARLSALSGAFSRLEAL